MVIQPLSFEAFSMVNSLLIDLHADYAVQLSVSFSRRKSFFFANVQTQEWDNGINLGHAKKKSIISYIKGQLQSQLRKVYSAQGHC